LQVNLDWPLPAGIAIGRGTALFVGGTCFDSEEEIVSLQFVVAGQEQPVWAWGMPRLDHFRGLHPTLDAENPGDSQPDPDSAEDPSARSYRSGFWGLVRISEPPPERVLQLALKATLASGLTRTAHLATIPVKSAVRPGHESAHGADGAGPDGDLTGPVAIGAKTVAICMATYNPPLELFRRQIDSIRAQSHSDWVCLISDDCSRPDRYEEILGVIEGDSRFVASRSERRQGFYFNFERALRMVPGDTAYVALADQDDRWYPDKLQTLLDELGDAQLVYSDARIVGRDGEEISPTYWARRRRNHEDLLSLLVANCVTGAASLFRRDLLDVALPFPPAQFAHYHDHWLGLVARMRGRIAFVDRPLYDYVQHGQAALGHSAATRVYTLRQRASRIFDDPHERIRFYRARYFRDIARLMTFASILQMRCSREATAADSRTLERFLALEQSWSALGRLGWRAARELTGTPETLGAEWSLFRALLWRRLLSASAGRRPGQRLRMDAVPPPDLAPRGERRTLGDETSRFVAQKILPLELAVSESAPPRVNVLIPTVDLEHFFGGYIAKLNLARSLAERGARVRLVTVDPVGPLPHNWKRRVEAYSGLAGLFDQVEIEFAREAGSLQASPSDAFVASTWWTAHVAAAACQTLGRDGFVYLIQEFEPMTFPWGTLSALAAQSYAFPHFALFSSELLRDFFRRHQIGVYAAGEQAGDAASASFQNAITDVPAPARSELQARRQRRLLFYARPEPHAARNMFELGIMALGRALEEGAFRRGWELRGIGSVAGPRRVDLGGDVELEMMPRVDQRDYAGVLAQHDIGLALMCSPHPSLVPIEMASAGLLTVTNTFENKTSAALRGISENLIGGEPTVEGIAAALLESAADVGDYERRAAGASVRWSKNWQESFDDALLDRLEGYLAFQAAAA
jgi:glycosyltransferase involved in cell wall biosynthesis